MRGSYVGGLAFGIDGQASSAEDKSQLRVEGYCKTDLAVSEESGEVGWQGILREEWRLSMLKISGGGRGEVTAGETAMFRAWQLWFERTILGTYLKVNPL